MSSSDEPGWFRHDVSGRRLAHREETFVRSVCDVLGDLRPAQLIPSHTILTAEGVELLILILPHRHLDGVSIVVDFGSRRGSVSWARIETLSAHDDLDVGTWVANFNDLDDDVLTPALLDALTSELSRAIELEMRTRPGETDPYCATYRLAGAAFSGYIESRAQPWLRRRSRESRTTATTSFVSTETLPFSVPPDAQSWLSE